MSSLPSPQPDTSINPNEHFLGETPEHRMVYVHEMLYQFLKTSGINEHEVTRAMVYHRQVVLNEGIARRRQEAVEKGKQIAEARAQFEANKK